MAIPQMDWLKLAADAHTASTSYFDANIRNTVVADLRQFQGQHAASSKYYSEAYKGRSKFFRPKTRAAIRKNEATAAEAFFSTVDVVTVSAEDDRNAEQRAVAEVMQHLLQYRLTKSIPWFLILSGAYQDAQTVGLVASYQNWRYDEKKGIDQPSIELLPIENVRFDPGAPWTDVVNGSPYLIRLVPMYLKDVKARMTRPDPKTGAPKWKKLEDAQIASAARKYGDPVRLTREGNRADSKDQESPITDFTIVWAHEVFMEVDGEDYVYWTLGTEFLLSDPVGIREVYWTGRRPIVIGYCVIETHKQYPSSLPRLTRDTQKETNEIANQRIDNVRFAMNKRYFARRGRQVDLRSLTRNVPSSVTLMQDIDDVKVVDTPDVTRSSYEEQDRLNLDFDDLAGTFSQSSVQSNRNLNETVGGMQILNSNASQIGGYQLRTFVETWVEPVLRQLMQMEQEYETDAVVVGLAAEKADIFRKYGIATLTDEMLGRDMILNVNVGIGAINPQAQVNAFMFGMNSLRAILADGLLEKYGLDVQEVVKELFGKLGYRDGARFFNWEDQDPQLVALQGQIQQLQQALAAKSPPELIAAQVAKLMAEVKQIERLSIKSGVDTAYAAMQAGQVVATLPAVAPVADEIMRGAGYVPIGGFETPPALPAVPSGPPEASPFPPNRHPMMPVAPPSAGEGEEAGIETARADGVRAEEVAA